MGDELKSCPFCGGEAYALECEYANGWTICCRTFGCMAFEGGKHYSSEEKAIDAWNRRADNAESIKALNRAAGNWARADAENRELRELVADMYKTIGGLKAKIEEWLPCTDFCPRWESDCSDLADEDCWYASRMRKLGIEVAIRCEPVEARELESWESIDKENDFLRHECDELCGLIGDMHALLQRTCESRDECGRDCELWPEHNKQCELRDTEDRMAVLGIEVQE